MKSLLILISVVFSVSSFSSEKVVDFSSIKKILKNDNLESVVSKKQEARRKKNKRLFKKKLKRFDVPNNDSFWTFMSEYWLVKNAQILKWDVEKPDYGLNESFTIFLEKMGHYEKKFKILLLNTSGVSHFALPADKHEYIFVLSIPFIRVLDFSKLEISLLLFEDFLRAENGLFKNGILTKKIKKLLGSNFYKKKLSRKTFDDLLDRYDKLVFDKGFNFKQQFLVTRQMNQFLKSDLKMWKVYYGLIQKIDNLVKTNVMYSNYLKIYPSPELQLGWLTPIKKRR